MIAWRAHEKVVTCLCILQENLLRAITQVEKILQWDSPDSISSANEDSMRGKQYDVILYRIPPFVSFDDREGAIDPVSFNETAHQILLHV